MTRGPLAFAVPGSIATLTGGTIYDRRVIEALRDLGHDLRHIELPGSFPSPPRADMDRALALLADVPADVPLIVDGLAYGALDPAGLTALRAPLVPLVHHPLAEETGLGAGLRAHLLDTERRNLARACHVLVPSPHTARLLVERYAVPQARITIARPGTDRPRLAPAPTTPPLILSVGIQLPRKGHDILIGALSEIRDLTWRAVIVGAPLDPAYSARLRVLLSEVGLEARVTLAGQLSGDDLARLYGSATLFALATRYEGYGIVFDEALAHGLPIVSCRTGAVPETVPAGAGLLVPAEDPPAFGQALRRLLTEDTLRAAHVAAARTAGAVLPTWADTARTLSDAVELRRASWLG